MRKNQVVIFFCDGFIVGYTYIFEFLASTNYAYVTTDKITYLLHAKRTYIIRMYNTRSFLSE